MIDQISISNNIYSISGELANPSLLNAQIFPEHEVLGEDIQSNISTLSVESNEIYKSSIANYLTKNVNLSNSKANYVISDHYVEYEIHEDGSDKLHRLYSTSVLYDSPNISPIIYIIDVNITDETYDSTPVLHTVKIEFPKEIIKNQQYLNQYNQLSNFVDGKLVLYKGDRENNLTDRMFYIFVYANKFYILDLTNLIPPSYPSNDVYTAYSLSDFNVDNYYYEGRIKYNLSFSMFFDIIVIDANIVENISYHKLMIFYNFRFDKNDKYYLRNIVLNESSMNFDINVSSGKSVSDSDTLLIYENNEPFKSLRIWKNSIHASLGEFEYLLVYTNGTPLNNINGINNINSKNHSVFNTINISLLMFKFEENNVNYYSAFNKSHKIVYNDKNLYLSNINYFIHGNKFNTDLLFFANVFQNKNSGLSQSELVYGYHTIHTKEEYEYDIHLNAVKETYAYVLTDNSTYKTLNNFVSTITIGNIQYKDADNTLFDVVSLNTEHTFKRNRFTLFHIPILKPPIIQDVIQTSIIDGDVYYNLRFSTTNDEWTSIDYVIRQPDSNVPNGSINKNDVITVSTLDNVYDISRSNFKIEQSDAYGEYDISLELIKNIETYEGTQQIKSIQIGKRLTFDISGFLSPLQHTPTMLDEFKYIQSGNYVNFNLLFNYYKSLQGETIKDVIQYADFKVMYLNSENNELNLFENTYYFYTDDFVFIRENGSLDEYMIHDISFSLDEYDIMNNPFTFELKLGIINQDGSVVESSSLVKEYNGIGSITPPKPYNVKLSSNGEKDNPSSDIVVLFKESSTRWNNIELQIFDVSSSRTPEDILIYPTGGISQWERVGKNELNSNIVNGYITWEYKIPIQDISTNIGGLFGDDIKLKLRIVNVSQGKSYTSEVVDVSTSYIPTVSVDDLAIEDLSYNYYYPLSYSILTDIFNNMDGFQLLYKEYGEYQFNTWRSYNDNMYQSEIDGLNTTIRFNTNDGYNNHMLKSDTIYDFKVQLYYGGVPYESNEVSIETPEYFFDVPELNLSFDKTNNTLTTRYRITTDETVDFRLLNAYLEYKNVDGLVLFNRNINTIESGDTVDTSFEFVESSECHVSMIIDYPLDNYPLKVDTFTYTPIKPYNITTSTELLRYTYYYDVIWQSPTSPSFEAFIDMNGMTLQNTTDNNVRLSFTNISGTKTFELYIYYTYTANGNTIIMESDKSEFTLDIHECKGLNNNISETKKRIFKNDNMSRKRMYALGTRRLLYR
jgi:hypothetical protein